MNRTIMRRAPLVLMLIACAIAFSGCAVSDGYYDTGMGYGGDDDFGYGGGINAGMGFFEPPGAFYGGWGPGFAVGPYGDRGGPRHWDGMHSYRSAPAWRGVPSIPRGGRFGGGGRR